MYSYLRDGRNAGKMGIGKMENSLLIAGSIAIDLVETAQDKRDNILGGSVTHALIPSGKQVPVIPVGIIGSDFPENGMDIYKKFSETMENVQQVSGQTFRWGGKYHENWDQRDTLFTELGVFENYNPVLSDSAKNAAVVFLANIHPELQLSVLDQCTNPHLVITDSMNLWINTAKDDLLKVLKRTNIFLINEEESQQLTTRENLADAAEQLLQMGPDTVIIKMGSRGSAIFTADDCTCIPAVSDVSVIDPTGAGDTFGGGMSALLVLGESLLNAVSEGTAWASVCVEGFGIEKTLRTERAEIDRRKAEVLSGVTTC